MLGLSKSKMDRRLDSLYFLRVHEEREKNLFGLGPFVVRGFLAATVTQSVFSSRIPQLPHHPWTVPCQAVTEEQY